MVPYLDIKYVNKWQEPNYFLDDYTYDVKKRLNGNP